MDKGRSMRLDRLIYILLTLEKEKKVTAKRLAEELETSVRTIYRDIDTLCLAGIPICAESGQGGGISLMEGYQTQIKHMDKEDVIYLFLNGIGVKAETSSMLDQHTNLSLKKIMKTLPETQVEEIQQIMGRFVVDRSPWWGEAQTLNQIDRILQSVFQLHKIKITYQKLNQESTTRILRPYGIVIKEEIWYLVGYCESAQEIRMFRCERITDCVILDESFYYPKNFELKTYFENSLQKFKEKCAIAEQYFVTMTVQEEAFRFLKGMEYEIQWQKEQQWRIHVNLYSYENALRDHWNLLMCARDVEPIVLRAALREKLEQRLQQI